MRLRELRPDPMRAAIDAGQPLLLPAGCVEFHGHHLALGADTLFAEALCDAIAERMPAVVAPTIDYGPTGYALSDVDLGTIDTEVGAFAGYVKEVLRNFWEMGWRRVQVIIHHQGMDGPEALAFRRAAAELAFTKPQADLGRGWWGFRSAEEHPNWSRLQVGPSILPGARNVAGGDHAGIWETSLLLHLRPDLVHMDAVNEGALWFTQQPGARADEGTAERGRQMFEAMVSAWVEELSAD